MALVAADPTQRRAQRALLSSFGYQVDLYDGFDRFLADQNNAGQNNKVHCISVDLRGIDFSPADCLAEIRQNGIDIPVILLDDKVAQGNSNGARDVRNPDGGQAFLFWQPLDVELYLATLAAITDA